MTFGFVPWPYGGLWGDILRLLDRAVKRSGDSWTNVTTQLHDGRAQLWMTFDSGPVVAMVTRRDGDTLEVWLAGGSVLSGSVQFLETAIAAAKHDGATNGRITGRKGWDRVLKPYGWIRQGEDLVKEFS